MKVSRYNFFIPYENGKYIAYNSLSNAMALVSDKKYQIYLEFEKNNVPIEDKEFIKELKKGSFLIEDDLNELEIIRLNMYKERFNTSSLDLTIAPTSDCNFRCIYCYEKDAINCTYMSQEIEDCLIKILNNRSKNLSKFNVTWYGGEPLLAVDTIERLSEKFIKICDDSNIIYTATIVTNGYNLTKKNLDILKKCKIKGVQITIDGNAEIHDKRRFLKGGYPTFNKIISNICDLNAEKMPITLRINLDKSNFDKTECVLKILSEKQLIDRVFPYVAKVDNFNNCYNDVNCLSSMEFNKYENEFIKLMVNYGYEKEDILKHKLPKRINCVCGCDKFESYVINADGEMYKCWDDIGKSNSSIGNIKNNNIVLNKIYLDYIMFDPTTDLECIQCKYLPICMGGCAKLRTDKTKSICDIKKYNFNLKLINTALYMENIKNAQN